MDRVRKNQWMRFIFNDHPKLVNADGDALERSRLLAIAIVIMEKGDYGYNCYPGNALVGQIVECNKDTVSKYRAFLVDIGWFVPNGKKTRNLVHLDMSIPDREPIPRERKRRKANLGNLRSGKPSGKLSEPSRGTVTARTTEPKPKHVGPSDPWGLEHCPTCKPWMEKWRREGKPAEVFERILDIHHRRSTG